MSPSNPSSVPLQLTDPPATGDKASNCDATLAWIKASIASVYSAGRSASSSRDSPPTLSRKAWLNIYTRTHAFCMDAKQRPKRPGKDSLDGEDLYNGIREEIIRHCFEVRKVLLASGGSDEADNARHLIEDYMAHWQMLIQLAALISHLLQPLERDWILRTKDEKRKEAFLIKDLHTKAWKDEVLQVGVDSTEAAIGSKIEKAGEVLRAQGEDGGASDKDLAERFLGSLEVIRVGLGKERSAS